MLLPPLIQKKSLLVSYLFSRLPCCSIEELFQFESFYVTQAITIGRNTDEETQDVAMSINITPGKCLDFKSPVEAFLNELGKDMTIRLNTNLVLRS